MADYLLKLGINPNLKNQDKNTPLHAAIKLPSLAAVKWAAKQSEINFEKRAGKEKQSSLHLAANLGLVTIM